MRKVSVMAVSLRPPFWRRQALAEMTYFPHFLPKARSMRSIVFVTFDQALLLDIAGPLQVFASARDLARARGTSDPYAISVVAPDAGPTVTSSGLALVTAPLASVGRKPIDTLIVVGGWGSRQASQDGALLRWI